MENFQLGELKKKAASKSAVSPVHQKCPVPYCPRSYTLDKKLRLINHVLREHRPIVQKMELMKKIDSEHEHLKAEQKKKKLPITGF